MALEGFGRRLSRRHAMDDCRNYQQPSPHGASVLFLISPGWILPGPKVALGDIDAMHKALLPLDSA
jgi:hypothetical protein